LAEAEDAASCVDSSNIELKEYLGKVDEMYREVIVLKYISGYSQEEISGFLNIPVGTVKSRIYRGIQMLKESMKREVLE
jgi:RNA polymerase sigma-70 factor (ECF subfamily)